MQETIVLFAIQGMGHTISMVELGKLILHNYSHKFSSITIIITTSFPDTPAISDYIQYITQSYPSISFHRLSPQPIDSSQIRKHGGMVGVMFEFNRINPPIIHIALQEISKTSTIKASLSTFFLYLPKIHEQKTPDNLDNPSVYRFPGISLVRPSDIAALMSNHFLYFFSALPKANGIIVNTFDGFEPVAMKAVEDGVCVPDGPTPPVYYIGPFIGSLWNEKGGGNAIAMEEEEEEDYLKWLDKQPSRSVVFLCFGSQGTFSEKQAREVAIGLENSGKRFLWVLKKPAIDDKTKRTVELEDFDLGSVLPEGFTKRTRDVGRVVKSWVSQVEVLKKESQYLNRNALVFDMGMAVPVEQREEDRFVSGTELEKRIRELMESEKGRELRERSRKMKEMSLDAFGETGSSKLALKSAQKLTSEAEMDSENNGKTRDKLYEVMPLKSTSELFDASFFSDSKMLDIVKGAKEFKIPTIRANRKLVASVNGGLRDPSCLTFNPDWGTKQSHHVKSFNYPLQSGLKRPDNEEDIAFMNVLELGELIKTKQITFEELTQIFLQRLIRYNPVLEAVISYTEDLAYKQAKEADELISQGVYWDIISVPQYKTTWGSRSFKDQVLDIEAWVYKR
ncbi:hypothetical protein FNV43_RR15303 [Rhamnella rubrinervis]|uniref:Uncharacterized protein n=1 Tax=Rhamnella rubrinervis TaxID=2594499 RepID=A0A8K0E8J4_9ROSA|nr:hypothetical protein FNV43_RR15303 [Rhamnella rubrinervis]